MLQWRGSVSVLFSGTHYFWFSPSEETPGGTTLVQGEDVGGLLAFLLGPTWIFGRKALENFEALNRDLKLVAEVATRSLY